MNTFDLPAADPAAVRIREAATRGNLSHALLFTGSGDRLAAARYAAAALECMADGVRPCGVCEGCRKVLSGIHPDVTVVRDEQHKNSLWTWCAGARGRLYPSQRGTAEGLPLPRTAPF